MKKLLVVFAVASLAQFGCLSSAATDPADSLVAGADLSAANSLLDAIGDGSLLDAFSALAGGDLETLLASAAGRFGGHHGGPFADILDGLTDEQVAQVQELREQLHAGEITRDEFRTQFESITGVALPERGFGGHHGGALAGILDDLTDEQRTQIEALRDQLRSDEITFDEFRTQFETVAGVAFPEHSGPFADILADLTDEQVAQVEALRDQLHAAEITFDEFRTQFETITGVALPQRALGGHHGGFGRGGFGHRGFGFFGGADLNDDQRTAIQALVEQLRSGEIDRATFHEQATAIVDAAK